MQEKEEGEWKGQPTSKVIKCNHKLYAQPFGNVLKCSAFSDIPKDVWVCLCVRVTLCVCARVCALAGVGVLCCQLCQFLLFVIPCAH